MISFLIKYKNVFLILTILFFLGSLGFVGAGVFMEEYGPNAAVAYVGKTKIKVKDYENSLRLAERAMREQGTDADEDAVKKLRQEVLQALINEESMAQSAAKYGLGVSDIEIGYTVRNMFSNNGLFNKQAYVWLVRNQFGMNPSTYEAMLRKQKLAAKFQNALILSAKVTMQEAAFFAPERAKEQPRAKKGAKQQQSEEPKTTSDAIALILMETKAQSLADSFTRQFNARETVEVKQTIDSPNIY
jgi:hypothetical protein